MSTVLGLDHVDVHLEPRDALGAVERELLAVVADDLDVALVDHLREQVRHGQPDRAHVAGLGEGVAQGGDAVDGLGEAGDVDLGLVEDGLVEQVDVEALVPGELVVDAVDQLLFPQAGEVDVLDRRGDLVVQRQQDALARVLAHPALGDREVDDVGRAAGVERVVQVVLEGGLVVLPVDLDARVGRLEAGDRVLDVLVERGRQIERPERISAFASTLGITASAGSAASGVGLAGASLAGADAGGAGWRAPWSVPRWGRPSGPGSVSRSSRRRRPRASIVASPAASSLREVTWFLLSPGPFDRIRVHRWAAAAPPGLHVQVAVTSSALSAPDRRGLGRRPPRSARRAAERARMTPPHPPASASGGSR